MTMDKYPILRGLLESGHVTVDDGTYVGIASDGTEVNLGTVSKPEWAERYLTDFPTPDMW